MRERSKPQQPWQYDWFFNARTGNRLQFWLSSELRLGFNAAIILRLVALPEWRLPQ